MISSMLIVYFFLTRVFCWADDCIISDDKIECNQVDQNPSNISQFIKEINLDDSIEWSSVTIGNKNFPKLSKYLFEDMTIDRLYLEHNNIQWIEQEAFDRINGLTELYLSRNELTEFKSSVGLASLKILDLSYNNLRLFDVNSFSYLEEIDCLRLEYNSIERIESAGGFKLSSLTQLFLHGNDLIECVNNTFAPFPSLQVLWIYSNNLQATQPGCFQGLVSLNTLDMSKNLMTDSFPVLDKMKLITFYASSNLLKEVSAKLLKGLKNVKNVYLFDNFIETIHQDAWKDLKKVTMINLDQNGIQQLTTNMFKYAGATLQFLYISENKIKEIQNDAFAGLEDSLTNLRLEDNRLEYLKSYYFKGLKKLKTLYIGDNLISFIEVNTFSDLYRLETLDLSYNTLFNIQQSVLSDLQSLTTLLLAENCLRSISIFTGLSELTTLDVSSNRITQIDFGFLNKNSPNLDKLLIADNIFDNPTLYVSEIGITLLDVSRTNLEAIKIDRTMSKLSSLNISNNPFLQSVEGLNNTGLKKLYMRKVNLSLLNSIGLSRIILQLTELDISYNDMDDVDISFHHMPFMVKLRLSNTLETKSLWKVLTNSDTLTELDISGNKLSTLNLANNEIELDSQDREMSLKYLDLSLNCLKVIKNVYFKGLTKLQEIYLSNNLIESIEPHSFALEQLYILDLQNNKIKYFSYVYFDLNTQKSFELIDLSNNEINSFELTGFSQLKQILLSSNNLTNQDIYGYEYGFSDALILSLSNNNLTHIEQHFLARGVVFKRLNLSHNQIVYIEANSFSSLVVIEKVDLSYNQISEVDENLFVGLSSLNHLDLSHNQLNAISKQLFRDLVSMKYLGLCSNQIKLIEDSSFQSLNYLTKLTLDSNSADLVFSNRTFTGLESISFITISPEYFNTRENLIAVKESLLSNSGRYVSSRSYSSDYKIEYYRAISLNYLELPSSYTFTECYNIIYLTRNGIQLNVNSEEGVELFVTQCSIYLRILLFDN